MRGSNFGEGGAMAEPTDEQLKAYMAKLPDVFRATLDAFVEYDRLGRPLRRRGGAMLTLETLDERLAGRFSLYRIGDTEAALERLFEKGFVIESSEPILHYKPTALGERLISVITGGELVPESVPELPDLVWA